MDSPQRRSKPNNGITYVYLDEVENKRHNSEMEESDKEEIKIDLLYHVDKDIRYSPQLMEQVLLKFFTHFLCLLTRFICIGIVKDCLEYSLPILSE